MKLVCLGRRLDQVIPRGAFQSELFHYIILIWGKGYCKAGWWSQLVQVSLEKEHVWKNHGKLWLLKFVHLNWSMLASLCRLNTLNLYPSLLPTVFHVWDCPPLPAGKQALGLPTLCLLTGRAGSPAALSKTHLHPHAGTPSAQQRCGWMNTSSTTMRPDHLPLGSRLEGKLPPDLGRRALVSPLLERNSFWIFCEAKCGKQTLWMAGFPGGVAAWVPG